MRKNFFKIYLILTFFILTIFNFSYNVEAANTYSAPLSTSIANISYIKNWQGKTCISGTSNIYENLNGSKISLSSLPKITLESADNKISKVVYVEKKANNSYYFDVDIDDLDFSKTYVLKIKSGNSNNTYEKQTLPIKNNFISVSNKHIYITISNNEITLSKNYSAPLSTSTANISYVKNWQGKICISGTSNIYEKINGSKVSLSTLPKMTLESSDGKFSKVVYVEKKDNNSYYFDVDIDDLDFSKTYVFKIKCGNSYNTYKAQTFPINNNFISVSNKHIYITISDNNINLSKNYSAPLSASTANISYVKNWQGKICISGTSNIYEKINDSKVSLSTLPKMTLESSDGKFSKVVYVEKKSNNSYYFDVDIDDLDFSKTYLLKIKSGNSYNTYKAQTFPISNNYIAVSNKHIYITINNNSIEFSKNYSAEIAASRSNLYYIKNWQGKTCIAGTTSIYEKSGTSKISLSTLPKMTLESTDGKSSKTIYVEKRNKDLYYFDIDIDDLDFSKTYMFKIKSGDSYNIHEPQTFPILNEFIPISNKHIYVSINNNSITFNKNYNGSFICDPANLELLYNWNGETCIGGTLNISEYISNDYYNLTATPIINMMYEDGTLYKAAYVEKRGNSYYFDVIIDNIDISKKCYIQIKSGNKDSNIPALNIQIKSILNSSDKAFIPSISNNVFSFTKNYTPISKGIYGYSGLCYSTNSDRGVKLEYYKIGTGSNVLFAVFELHGYEDLWAGDGAELTYIAENFAKKLSNSNDKYIGQNWTVYIFPKANPDGLNYGYTNNGPGRTTLYSPVGNGIDLNRCWSTDFIPSYSSRNYTGSYAFAAPEAQFLRDFMITNKSKRGQTIVIDLHGWTTQLIGDRDICLNYYGPQFYSSYNESISRYTSSYGKGYMINWARYNLKNNNGLAAKSALIELPSAGIKNHQTVINANYSQKYYNATTNMLKGII